jgi:hypothetical protein
MTKMFQKLAQFIEKYGVSTAMSGLKLYAAMRSHGRSRDEAINEMAEASEGLCSAEDVALLADTFEAVEAAAAEVEDDA